MLLIVSMIKSMLKIIRNEKEYDEALNRIDELMELNPELGTVQSDELEILVLLVEKYLYLFQWLKIYLKLYIYPWKY